jgi:hypothetical protein
MEFVLAEVTCIVSLENTISSLIAQKLLPIGASSARVRREFGARSAR